jgi:tetratricopeptide (TPR) repeat protein
MKHFMVRAGALSLLVLFLVPAIWAQYGGQQQQPPAQQQQPSAKPGAQAGAPGNAAPAGPVVPKEEQDAYKLVNDARSGDPAHVIELSEAFVAKYPQSSYASLIYAQLTLAYLSTGQQDKMLVAGNKALELDPDDVDVLPLLAMAIPRLISSKTTDAPQQLQKAEGYARHGIELLSAIPKPDGIDDAMFAKAKNDKLAMCHSGLGLVNLDRGKYADAASELAQSVQLASSPDPVDYFLLGRADEKTSHFTDAIEAYNKCAASGPLQGACKSAVEETKKEAQTGLEAPK